MATMFGRFDVQNEISKSETALIYKALDMESNQVVALKTQRLAPLGDRSAAFVETLVAEGEVAQPLTGQNIAQLYGAGEIDGQFCAAMEYIQETASPQCLPAMRGFRSGTSSTSRGKYARRSRPRPGWALCTRRSSRTR